MSIILDQYGNKLVSSSTREKVRTQGYGDHGASRTKKSLQAWNPLAGDAEGDIHNNLDVLRPRTRDLFMGGPIANGAIKTMRTNVIGTGLRLKPSINKKMLRLSDIQADDLKEKIELEFSLWAESKYCDASGLNDFYELQQLAFLSWMVSGDSFALLPLIEEKHSVYDLRIRLIEADRCSTPTMQSEDISGKDITHGVEANSTGRIVAYWFSDKHPGSMLVTPTKWTRVESVGQNSGRRNVLHLMESERPEQRRGVPVLAPVIEALKQVARYTDAELMAAVISGMFTVFIETEAEDTDAFGLEVETDNLYGEPLPTAGGDLKLGNGAVQFLEKGEKASIANPGRPNTAFDGFVTAILRQVGSSLEIPYELLIKHFTASYSASRAALLEAWKMFRMRRAWMTSNFCQPIYEEWFVDAVVKGRIDAPGIFDDPLLFRAYTRAVWHGPSQGLLNPVQEVNAAKIRISEGLSTRERESMEMGTGDFISNHGQLVFEEQMRRDGSLVPSGGGDKQNAKN